MLKIYQCLPIIHRMKSLAYNTALSPLAPVPLQLRTPTRPHSFQQLPDTHLSTLALPFLRRHFLFFFLHEDLLFTFQTAPVPSPL